MEIEFFKYQGAGNDFIVIDNRNQNFDASNNELVKNICDRRFGVGGDGLMLLQNKDSYDFQMVYFNSDGYEGTMCGNGGRCIVAFANFLGIISKNTKFKAVDGDHEAIVDTPEFIKLQMNNVSNVEIQPDYYFLDTGSPHYVQFVKGIEELDVYNLGRKIRYNDRFKKEGTNVNFVEEINNRLLVRTYERGVENETLACGTGIAASAICASLYYGKQKDSYDIKALGGDLKVSYQKSGETFSNIWLEGPAKQVFKGAINV